MGQKETAPFGAVYRWRLPSAAFLLLRFRSSSPHLRLRGLHVGQGREGLRVGQRFGNQLGGLRIGQRLGGLRPERFLVDVDLDVGVPQPHGQQTNGSCTGEDLDQELNRQHVRLSW